MASFRRLGALDEILGPETLRISSNPPSVLFHYTSHAGLLGIIQSGGMYLSDARFLNDSSELHYGVEVMVAALKRKAGSSALLAGRVDEILRLLGGNPSRGDGPVSDMRFYVASFCEDGNLLSQWRAYSGPWSGCSIGFDSARLDPDRSQLRRVLYDREEQDALADLAVDACIDVLQGPEDAYNLSILVESAVERVAPQIKNPVFAAEKEWRLVHAQRGTATKFREQRGGVVPYMLRDLRCDSGTTPLLPIVEVCHGPSERLSLNQLATTEVLQAHGYREAGIAITGSGIPLRS